jgi:hypothetical protein
LGGFFEFLEQEPAGFSREYALSVGIRLTGWREANVNPLSDWICRPSMGMKAVRFVEEEWDGACPVFPFLLDG